MVNFWDPFACSTNKILERYDSNQQTATNLEREEQFQKND